MATQTGTGNRVLTAAYRAALGSSLAVAAVAVAFFFIGISDGSVSSFNIGIWLLLLGAIGAVLAGGIVLRRRGKTLPALLVLALAAVPGIIGALFLLMLLVAQPRWN